MVAVTAPLEILFENISYLGADFISFVSRDKSWPSQNVMGQEYYQKEVWIFVFGIYLYKTYFI